MNRYMFQRQPTASAHQGYAFFKGDEVALYPWNACGMEFVRADEADELIAELEEELKQAELMLDLADNELKYGRG